MRLDDPNDHRQRVSNRIIAAVIAVSGCALAYMFWPTDLGSIQGKANAIGAVLVALGAVFAAAMIW
jgi:hypothetical protein